MRRSKLGIGLVTTTAALATGALALAPTAIAVEPTTATVSADCGSYGSGEATLVATQDGTSATITVTSSAVTAPIAVPAGTVDSTLTLTLNGSGTTTFTGNDNPAMAAGDDVTTGPLSGTVAAGDVLEVESLEFTALGLITVNCTATSPQSPGPFEF
ncbi:MULTISPECIES: hypothetical protein [unclassified Streptomyces]|uniref:Uncharacterized protein n=1 Tax=Streptomyces johnsoniae TaxID=3075532 RepID=A0ABU2S5N2_9ACTN|nr:MULTISPECIES: hypothetical protein [unclassified Streptomyces]MDT0444001.1 hypothetical protein [Streptomyces sp. DSM 41886]ONK14421.1 hypothetical protein STBA_52060 [Streptomyces sp. MP131-18]